MGKNCLIIYFKLYLLMYIKYRLYIRLTPSLNNLIQKFEPLGYESLLLYLIYEKFEKKNYCLIDEKVEKKKIKFLKNLFIFSNFLLILLRKWRENCLIFFLLYSLTYVELLKSIKKMKKN